jgi:hypothetical protein
VLQVSIILEFKYYGTPCNVKKIQTGDLLRRLPAITELVISPYPTISQQFLGFKKLSFVGEITTFQGHEKPEIYARCTKPLRGSFSSVFPTSF